MPGFVCLGHAAVQYDHLDGAADAQHTPFVRPIRTGDHRRTDPRQETAHRPSGQVHRGSAKLGLDIVDRRYVINQDEAKLVKRIFKLALQLQSCQKVADALNAEGLRTKVYQTKTGKQFGGELWSGRRVYETLVDQKYIGRIVHKGVSYQADHQAIVTEDLFEHVQKMLAANKTYTHKHQATRYAMLRRLVYCGECGSLVMLAWTNNHGREYRYYTCSKKVKSGYQKYALPSLPAGELEKIVVEQLRSL